MFDDVIEITKPDPDSQYRLIPCKCGSSEVVYARCVSPYCYDRPQKKPPEPSPHDMWRVVCTDCGETTTLEPKKHDAQIRWNGRKKPSWQRD